MKKHTIKQTALKMLRHKTCSVFSDKINKRACECAFEIIY